MNDFRLALRNLFKSPGFAAAGILTLAIAIGANTAMFSILYAVILHPLPFRDPERLMRVWETVQDPASLREGASMEHFLEWQKQQRVFAAIAGTTNRRLNLTDANAEAERVAMTGVSHNTFEMLGVAPLAGRGFVAADDRPGAAAVALISESLWRRRFGAADVIGRPITLDGEAFEIAGVLPDLPGVGDTAKTDVWLPLTFAVKPLGPGLYAYDVEVIGRLKDGVSRAQAQNEMRVIAARIAAQSGGDGRRGVFVEPLFDALVRDVRPRLYLLGAAVLAVLLIACINVAGLLLARADARVRELAIRASLGASRARIIRQLLTESIVLASIGALLGGALAWWATRTLLAMAPALPRAADTGMQLPVLFFAIGAAVLSAMLFGVVPAIRTSNVQPAQALGSARGVLRGTRTAGRGVLVIAEVALAVVLVIGAALLLKSFSRLMKVDVGLNASNVVTFSMKLPDTKYPPASRTNFYDALLDQVRAQQGVTRAALATNHPLDLGFTSGFDIVGQPRAESLSVNVRPVSSEYFEALGIPLLRGRAVSPRDRNDTPKVVVINEALAAKYFGNQDPIDKQIMFWGWRRTIVGVVKGERFGGPQADAEPALYPPLAQVSMPFVTLVVRANGKWRGLQPAQTGLKPGPTSTIANVRDIVRTLDSEIALYDVELLNETLERTVATPKFQAILITSFGAIALLLAAIGLYALIAYQVQQRTNEIGVRLALGATHAEIARLVLRRAGSLALTGIVIGLAGALATGRFLESLVFQISTRDPAIYMIVPLLLAAVVLLATWVPVRRAMRLDPAVALHSE